MHNQKALQTGRNKDLFTAALCHYVTEQLGGSVVTNCKSAKDRTGLEIIMADAIDIYVRTDSAGELPQFDEQDSAKRARFIGIFRAIFDSQHHQLIANDNSPGSQGIKDGGALDPDIIEALGDSYTVGKKLAGLNKPKTFWAKYKKPIVAGLLILATIVSIALLASGVLTPLGLVVALGVCMLGAHCATLWELGKQNRVADKNPHHAPATQLSIADDEVTMLSESKCPIAASPRADVVKLTTVVAAHSKAIDDDQDKQVVTKSPYDRDCK